MKKRFLSLIILFSLLFSASADVTITASVFVREGGGTLNLRKGPTTSSESLGIVKHGDSVDVYQMGEEWSYIYVYRLARAGYLKTKYLNNIEYHNEGETPYPVYDVTASYGSAQGYDAPCIFNLDLDGDGSAERLTFETLPTGEYDEETSLYVASESGKADSFVCNIHSFAQIWFVRLDGTPRVYMFVSGDEMSSDFSTYCLFWDGTHVKRVSFVSPAPYSAGDLASGGVTDIQNGIVSICDHRDLFGTWFATLDYSMNGNTMQYCANPVWTIENDLSDPETWKYRGMTVKTDLPAVSFERFVTIPAGTRLLICAIDDLNSRAYFITDSGLTGYFEYGVKEGFWGRTIDGIPEDDCFENICYAG